MKIEVKGLTPHKSEIVWEAHASRLVEISGEKSRLEFTHCWLDRESRDKLFEAGGQALVDQEIADGQKSVDDWVKAGIQ